MRPAGMVFGSVIMKKRKTRISGDETSSHQNSAPSIGPTCHAAVIVCPLAASTPIPAANASQNPTAIPTRCRRRRMRNPPATMSTSAMTSAGESGPHQSASGSARCAPRSRKQRTRPKFDGLKMCRPRTRIRYFESNATAEVPAKIHHPFVLHQSPCSVPGTRSTNATPFPVRSALAGHISTRWLLNAIANSRIAATASEMRICAIESWKSNATWPRTWSVMMMEARCSLGSRSVGSSTGYSMPRMRNDGLSPPTAGALMERNRTPGHAVRSNVPPVVPFVRRENRGAHAGRARCSEDACGRGARRERHRPDRGGAW